MRRIGIVMVILAILLGMGANGEVDRKMEMTLQGSMGRLYGVLQMPSTGRKAPLVILSHGFGGTHAGHRDYADYFTEHGFATFNFDFCGGGKGSRSDGTMLEMSVLTEAEDLNAVVDRFVNDGRFSRIFLYGGSQGGFVSSCVAAQRPGDIDAMVLEYPAYVLQDDARKRMNPDGTFPETETVLGNTISHKYGEDAVSFDIYDMIRSYTGDVLILHGDRDGIVPLQYSERAAGVFPHARLVVMHGQDHGFTGEARKDAMRREAEFFRAHSEQ